MLDGLQEKLKAAERRVHNSFGTNISTPAERRKSWWHFQLMDHAFLRTAWTNFDVVSEGVYRSNQPSPARLRRYREMGIRTILNLRGPSRFAHYLFEREACRELGLELIDHTIYANKLPTAAELLGLSDIFGQIERPFLMHCKSGADRAGFASALYRILVEGRPVAESKTQLHWRFLHFRNAKTGILDHFLTTYGEAQARTGVGLREWIANDYDRDALTREFASLRAAGQRIR